MNQGSNDGEMSLKSICDRLGIQDLDEQTSINFTTNTSWLLNEWFPKHAPWPHVRAWVKEQHEESKRSERHEKIRITIQVIPDEDYGK